jgi:hypothetical protein
MLFDGDHFASGINGTLDTCEPPFSQEVVSNTVFSVPG